MVAHVATAVHHPATDVVTDVHRLAVSRVTVYLLIKTNYQI